MILMYRSHQMVRVGTVQTLVHSTANDKVESYIMNLSVYFIVLSNIEQCFQDGFFA
jgi:ABC-type proline/glycine betaine transport system ATPase subunit